ncbi:MAG: hypothetical protein AB7E37_01240 [Candidatus Altimarinota bacterium]
MIDQVQKQSISLLNSISTLKSNKNPFGVFFMLADLKDIFISIGEMVLNSIELNYSKSARDQYKIITQKYKDAGIFEALYNHYFHTNELKKFKYEIDHYFEHSFFVDSSFFFFTLSRSEKFDILFDIFLDFYLQKEHANTYFSLNTYVEKKSYLAKIDTRFSLVDNDKISFYIIKFLNQFKDFDFSEISLNCHGIISDNIKIIKKITLFILQNSEKYPELREFILEAFILDRNIYEEVIEKLEEEKLFEVILFLKNDIHSGIDNTSLLNYEMKNNISMYLKFAKRIEYLDLEKRIDFLIVKENEFIALGKEKGNFARLSFKRQYLEENHGNIIDLVLGITDIPSEVFYLVKQQTLDVNLENISLYNEIKDLILYIDKSYFLSFVRPFLLRKIARYFNNSDQRYYVIKFIACVVLSNSYSEYKILSKFFYNLEMFYRKGIEAYISRIFQFGWIIIFTFIIGYFLPFGFLLAVGFFILKEIIVLIIARFAPKLKMSLNFQTTTYVTLLAVISIFLGTTIGYKDNTQLTYNYFKPFINAAILPAHESLKILSQELRNIKADILGTPNISSSGSIDFSQMDYLEGKYLHELKK